MDNLQILGLDRQLSLRIPATILSHTDLTFNQKLILGLDYTLSLKMGYNKYTNKKVGEMLSLHPNIVCYCRRQLTEKDFLKKDGRKYTLTGKHEKFEVDDRREIILPYEVYNHADLTTGAKLLWGEYNSISKGHRQYFASREYSAKRLNASVESVTSWTKQLFENVLLIEYSHKTSFRNSQKVIVTTSF